MLSIQAVRDLPRLRAPDKTMETVKNLPATVGVNATGDTPPRQYLVSRGRSIL